jgi:hypothetical protein
MVTIVCYKVVQFLLICSLEWQILFEIRKPQVGSKNETKHLNICGIALFVSIAAVSTFAHGPGWGWSSGWGRFNFIG